jgi:hypothetical protein
MLGVSECMLTRIGQCSGYAAGEARGDDQFFEAELRLVEIELFRATAERTSPTFSIMRLINLR